MQNTRRDVIKALAALPLIRFQGSDPDLVLHNGRVYTGTSSGPGDFRIGGTENAPRRSGPQARHAGIQ